MGQFDLKAAALVLAAAAIFSATSVTAGDYYRKHRPHHDSGLFRLHEISTPQDPARPQTAGIAFTARQHGSDFSTADGFEANGGTYVFGYSDYDPYADARLPPRRPRAKIIDVRLAGSACSYEAGVCVIRP
ncbi:hypothetical protein [Rhizobium sp. BK602]|uniref:hypothetical protein n=1 Tax=Rhizobium sp. BK602 TaxID=2586986 RepID=UPI00161D28C9|nr:hypothetical protein [Rhizobium sp. BK602]MBB3611908.1 hypothetical protein [Rhizobium sp. BK602]